MIDTPTIGPAEAQPAAVIRMTIPRDQIQAAMGPAFGELFGALEAQGIAPAGPAFSHHLRMVPDLWDFELGVPVAAPIAPTGRVQAGELPGAARVARTVYHGGYAGLGEGWGAFDAWLTEQGLRSAENLWERYVVGPETGDDESAYRTELVRPLVG